VGDFHYQPLPARHKLLGFCIIGPSRVEQLLNVVWLFAALGLVFAVRARPHRRLHPHTPYAVAVIFACVALLLFPVISASDDLHPACVLGDDTSWRHDKRALGVQLLAVFILVSLAPLLLCRVSQLRDVRPAAAAAQPGHLRLDAGRAPPVRF
jgi:hypothetical protein